MYIHTYIYIKKIKKQKKENQNTNIQNQKNKTNYTYLICSSVMLNKRNIQKRNNSNGVQYKAHKHTF